MLIPIDRNLELGRIRHRRNANTDIRKWFEMVGGRSAEEIQMIWEGMGSKSENSQSIDCNGLEFF